MKVYISSDMEGSTGVVSAAQTDFQSPDYEFGRRMQLHDTLAAARAALAAGAETVLVNDAHDRMTNLDASVFPAGVQLISGSPKILGMVDGVADSDVALFIGYHAMAGTEKAVLDHTYSSDVIYSLKVNGNLLGETGLNALFCGALGVPVGLVTGDRAVCLEASSLLGPDLVTCEIKEGVGRTAALTLPAVETEQMIKASVKAAMAKIAAGKCPKLETKAPYTMEVAFHNTQQADEAGLVPGSERVSGRALVFHTDDVFELRRWFNSALDVCESLMR
jgi:D-amino peptidase